VVFGEVLYDCYPDGRRVLGGAPFNVAWHLVGFGLAPWFVSAVGNDAAGAAVRLAMADWGLDDSGLSTLDGLPTGNVQVRFEHGEPSYDIAPDQAWDRIGPAAVNNRLEPLLVYHGTLAMRTAASRRSLAALVARCAAPVFVDLNLRPPWWSTDTAIEALGRARWVKLNRAELSQLAGSKADLERQALALIRCHDLELVIVTRGADGATAVDAGGQVVRAAPSAGTRCVDPVGAGDAFCAVIVAGIVHSWPIATSLERAQAFAASVIGMAGATSNDRRLYEQHRRQWRND
jgi:fructokinase